eukprot:GEMP01009419.1.p1 GENE.GEMP01009419.1~~GEMP01009419.1.p1  ORF type:complete len:240 (+),score=51.38 GEMP01009419.1:1698-2417(+)
MKQEFPDHEEINGRPSYVSPKGARISWSGTQWEFRQSGEENVTAVSKLQYLDVPTTKWEPPEFAVTTNIMMRFAPSQMTTGCADDEMLVRMREELQDYLRSKEGIRRQHKNVFSNDGQEDNDCTDDIDEPIKIIHDSCFTVSEFTKMLFSVGIRGFAREKIQVKFDVMDEDGNGVADLHDLQLLTERIIQILDGYDAWRGSRHHASLTMEDYERTLIEQEAALIEQYVRSSNRTPRFPE